MNKNPKAKEKPKIVVVTPKGLRTGGPEAMHQLHFELQKFGVNTCLIPWPGTKFRAPITQYLKYQPIWHNIWNVRKNDTVIMPESLGNLPFWYFLFLSKKNIWLWMLSVDFSSEKKFQKFENRNFKLHGSWNTYVSKVSTRKFDVKSKINLIGRILQRKLKLAWSRCFRKSIVINNHQYLFQSYYAKTVYEHINKISLKNMCTDYTDTKLLPDRSKNQHCTCKKYHVAYFPGKSSELINILLSLNNSQRELIHFCPIINLEEQQVEDLLFQSDLYVDLGYFPGKDRLPREAIILNCPVLLAKRGSARYLKDFPLSKIYLLDLQVLDPKATFEAIIKTLTRGKSRNLYNQRKFRLGVENEKEVFTKEVSHLIKVLRFTV
jgi:hypothetical protein